MATTQRMRMRRGEPHPATEEERMRAVARQSHQLPNPRLLPRGQRSRLPMQLKERRGNCIKRPFMQVWVSNPPVAGCRLESGRGLERRQRGKKEGAASPPVKKRGAPYLPNEIFICTSKLDLSSASNNISLSFQIRSFHPCF